MYKYIFIFKFSIFTAFKKNEVYYKIKFKHLF